VRLLLLSDLHANLPALEAVLQHAERQGWERALFLGDAVGYYPDPEAVIGRLRELPLEATLLGNHDALLLHLHTSQGHTSQGPNACEHNRERNRERNGERNVVTDVLRRQRAELSKGALRFLTTLRPTVVRATWEAVHGARSEPWRYLSSLRHAERELSALSRDLLFFGHTHVPAVYAFTEYGTLALSRSVPVSVRPDTPVTYRLPPNARTLINPGSVGQPRDGVPFASYMIFDDETRSLTHYRVAFDLARVRRRVLEAGYPEALAARLERGQ
jgi:predicted phosphodiesterase